MPALIIGTRRRGVEPWCQVSTAKGLLLSAWRMGDMILQIPVECKAGKAASLTALRPVYRSRTFWHIGNKSGAKTEGPEGLYTFYGILQVRQ